MMNTYAVRNGLASVAKRMGIERQCKSLWKHLNRFVNSINYTRRIRINGRLITIPSIRGIHCNLTEPWMLDLLGKLLRVQDGAFLDVGVNVGMTLVKVKALEWHREYIGFEPNPACIFYLFELIKRNHFEDCIVVPVGLYTHDCMLPLDIYTENEVDDSASLIPGFRPGSRVVFQRLVPVFSFDSVAACIGNTNIGICKIDVEGAELEVVISLREVVRRDRPIMLLEVLPVYSGENEFRRKRQEELESLFDVNGYLMFRIEKTQSDAFGGLKPIKTFGIHSDLRQCDYLAVPKEKCSNLQLELDIDDENERC